MLRNKFRGPIDILSIERKAKERDKTTERKREDGTRPGQDLRPSSLASECR